MSGITANEIGQRLLVALGLDGVQRVKKIVLTVEAGAVVTVEITRLTDKIEGDALVEELKHYELKAKE